MSSSDRRCCACLQSILDPYYLMIANRCWHLTCLKCIECGLLLDQATTCYSIHGRLMCRFDYVKYGSQVCAKCAQIIQKDDLILRAERCIFHLKCFTCSVCHILLQPGDHYSVKNSRIYCVNHLLTQGALDAYLMFDDLEYRTSFNKRFRMDNYQHNNDESQVNLPHVDCPSSYCLELDENYTNLIQYTRQKRLRTSFKHHQLRFMKSYFIVNHNPDAKDLNYLSEKTNLPKRVLQVWFQNARAKYRRSAVLSNDLRIDLPLSNNESDL